jgi:hypothetical protein
VTILPGWRFTASSNGRTCIEINVGKSGLSIEK